MTGLSLWVGGWAKDHLVPKEGEAVAYGVFPAGSKEADAICEVVVTRKSVRSKWVKMLRVRLRPKVDDALNSVDDTSNAGMREALTRAIDQAFPDTVSDLIDEWESMLGLPINKYGLLSSRVAAVLAKWRSRRGSSALDILETVRKFDVGAEIYENSSVDVYGIDIRFTHLFAIIVSSAVWADATTRAAIRTAVDSMKPAYTDYNLATRRGFRCDDAESLTDRDVLS